MIEEGLTELFEQGAFETRMEAEQVRTVMYKRKWLLHLYLFSLNINVTIVHLVNDNRWRCEEVQGLSTPYQLNCLAPGCIS